MTGQLGSNQSDLGAFILGGGADTSGPPGGSGVIDQPVLGQPSPSNTLGRGWLWLILLLLLGGAW